MKLILIGKAADVFWLLRLIAYPPEESADYKGRRN